MTNEQAAYLRGLRAGLLTGLHKSPDLSEATRDLIIQELASQPPGEARLMLDYITRINNAVLTGERLPIQ